MVVRTTFQSGGRSYDREWINGIRAFIDEATIHSALARFSLGSRINAWVFASRRASLDSGLRLVRRHSRRDPPRDHRRLLNVNSLAARSVNSARYYPLPLPTRLYPRVIRRGTRRTDRPSAWNGVPKIATRSGRRWTICFSYGAATNVPLPRALDRSSPPRRRRRRCRRVTGYISFKARK